MKKSTITEKAKENGKFVSMVNRTGDAVLKGRGERVISQCKLEQKTLIDNLSREIINLEDRKDLMMDISPDNRYALKVGEGFNAPGWVKEYQTVTVTLANKKIEKQIAVENYLELFGESYE